MAGIKKIKLGSPGIAKILIDKMLENHNVDYDYVVENQHINGVVWCSYYSWTQEESNNYKKWWFDFFQKNVSPKLSKRILEREYIWWDLMYGLKIKDDEKS